MGFPVSDTSTLPVAVLLGLSLAHNFSSVSMRLSVVEVQWRRTKCCNSKEVLFITLLKLAYFQHMHLSTVLSCALCATLYNIMMTCKYPANKCLCTARWFENTFCLLFPAPVGVQELFFCCFFLTIRSMFNIVASLLPTGRYPLITSETSQSL